MGRTGLRERAWRWLVGVPTTGDAEQDERARFLAMLLIAFFPLISVLGVVVMPRVVRPAAPMSTATFQAAVGLTLAVVVAFALNRLGHRARGAHLFVVGGLMAASWAGTDETQLLTLLGVEVVIAVALLSLRVAVAIGLAVAGDEQLLRRLLGAGIDIVLEMREDAGWVTVDPGQFEQVLLNLAINARDAMPRGGSLRLSTDALQVTTEHPFASLEPGHYGRLCVEDNGGGMEPDVLARAFEPFFTTKQDSKGTGLGLSTVYGIVQQSGGAVLVDSTPGVGTVFEVLLPAASPGAETRVSAVAPLDRSQQANAVVLVVEDNDMVRALAVRVLAQEGYRVIEEPTGTAVVRRLGDGTGVLEVDLLVTDVVMPDIGGLDVAKEFRKRFPGRPILFMSGYGDEVIAREGVRAHDGSFLRKPFTPSEFRAAVRAALGTRVRPES